MKLHLKIWRQKGPQDSGAFKDYSVDNASEHMSFLEMLDFLNTSLVQKGEEAVQFDHDCREGICGSCSLVINGNPHGPETGTATCQLHMRKFKDGDTIVIEPFRAKAFPVIRDLCVDRRAFDRIMEAGGFCSVNTGNAPEANAILIGKETAEKAMDSAACIGCGACVAACKNASAMLFVSAKVSQLALLPQGNPERGHRVRNMVAQMDKELFGACSNTGSCEAACPKEIKLENIARLNREMVRATLVE
ncbi:MAG: succinate dehydrogenase/fumarate reductase iron-sulfur subunit [Proteobacteria bacterium]|jgi:succinate dehydrogenase / fumarate reductase iron-sulfur subunit|nr:succinate dehydrogenase/fumarate reductase iron-sulfur subunit [Pseudomonadota bacterium]